MSRLKRLWIKGKFVWAFGLIVMILLRMIWVQIRVFSLDFERRSVMSLEQTFSEHYKKCAFPGTQEERLPTAPRIVHDQKSPPVTSPGFSDFVFMACRNGLFSTPVFLKYNQNLLLVVVFLAVLMSRLVTGGFMLPLIVGVVLLSRGRFIASIGTISSLLLVNTVVGFIMLSVTHWLRTGWRPSLGIALAAIYAAGYCQSALYFLGFALPLLIIFWRVLRIGRVPVPLVFEPNQGQDLSLVVEKFRKAVGFHRFAQFTDGSELDAARLLSPLRMPFSTWILFDKRWLKFGALSLAGAVVLAGLGVLSTRLFDGISDLWAVLARSQDVHGPLESWVFGFASSLDLDTTLALVFVFVSALSSKRRGMPGLSDVCQAAIMLLAAAVAASFVLDVRENIVLSASGDFAAWSSSYRAPRVLLWFEPIFLALWIVSVFNILKIIDSFVGRKKFSA